MNDVGCEKALYVVVVVSLRDDLDVSLVPLAVISEGEVLVPGVDPFELVLVRVVDVCGRVPSGLVSLTSNPFAS